MLTNETDMRMRSYMGNLDYCDVLREAGIHRTNTVSNKLVILPKRELV